MFLQNLVSDCFKSGIAKGDLVLLTGYTSIGKSSLMTNLFVNMLKNGYNTGFFTLQMSKEDIIGKMLRINGRGSMHDIIFSGYKFFIVSESCDCYDIKAICTEHKNESGLDIIFIDTLEWIAPIKDRNVEYSKVFVQSLKKIAKELDIAIILACQTKRIIDRKPTLHDIRGFNTLDDNVDIVLAIHSDDFWRGGYKEFDNIVEVIILKEKKKVDMTTVKLSFDAKTMTFKSLEKERKF